ncbi:MULTISPECIES: glycosyltransferase [unclassified Marinobacterium]|uniref:glycosyltransferase n=1 Tax=unclassified Marinobacterium TaxID=2644139 RepID=UPI001567D87C|nr:MULTISPECIES: glycosyltransferase [unclassified Marinobacterium]NRP09214.1 Glycosyltransferase Gtf1 [Marinobacterium sp. xm-g-48]NRP82255.1 Glycosyltransferase Gtf1 [Marinobacterium sp. xm-d-509]
MYVVLPSINQGGVTKATRLHIECFSKDVEVLVLSNNNIDELALKNFEGYNISFLGINSFLRIFSLISIIKNYRNVLSGDVVAMHFDSILFCLLVRFFGGEFKIFGYVHTDLESYTSSLSFSKRFFFNIFIYFFRFLDVVVFLTNTQREFFENRYMLGVSGPVIMTIPNPFDWNEVFGVRKKSNNYIVFAGRLSAEKNVDFIINAYCMYLAKGGNLRLKICGEGFEMDRLKSLARNLDVSSNIEFCGYVSNIQKVFDDSHLLVLASKVEGFPLVFLEALAGGVKVLTSAFSPSCYEIFDEGTNVGSDLTRRNYGIVDVFGARALDVYSDAMLDLTSADDFDFVSCANTLEKYSIKSVTSKWKSILS